jgi:hypothetical protein
MHHNYSRLPSYPIFKERTDTVELTTPVKSGELVPPPPIDANMSFEKEFLNLYHVKFAVDEIGQLHSKSAMQVISFINSPFFLAYLFINSCKASPLLLGR